MESYILRGPNFIVPDGNWAIQELRLLDGSTETLHMKKENNMWLYYKNGTQLQNPSTCQACHVARGGQNQDMLPFADNFAEARGVTLFRGLNGQVPFGGINGMNQFPNSPLGSNSFGNNQFGSNQFGTSPNGMNSFNNSQGLAPIR